MKFLILTLILISFLSKLPAQDSIYYNNEVINLIDENGQKQGVWKLFSPEDSLYLVCNYNDNNIDGLIDFFKNGKNIIRILNPNDTERKFIAFYKLDTLEGIITKKNDQYTLIDSKGEQLEHQFINWFWDNSTIMPKFYQGMEKLFIHIQDNINTENTGGKTGRIVLTFAINEFGYVSDLKIKKKANKKINKEGLRVMRTSPRWQPGFQRGIFVNTQFTLPIKF